MKLKNTIALPVLALVSLLPVAVADDPFGVGASQNSPGEEYTQIGVLVEWVQLDAPVAAKLVRKHATAADATEFRDEVQALVDEEKANARVLESGYIATTAGQRAKIESVHEFIYPTEYDPPSFGGFGGNADLTFPANPANPTAFDVRNIGHTMEVEPNVDADQKTISLNIAPEIVDFVNFITYGKDLAESQQPLFHVMKLQTNLVIPTDGYVLASIQMPRDPEAKQGDLEPDQSQRVLVFVRANLLRIPLEKKKDE